MGPTKIIDAHNVQIGKTILFILKRQHKTIASFARMLKTNTFTVHKMLQKDDLPAATLARFYEVLDEDLLLLYRGKFTVATVAETL